MLLVAVPLRNSGTVRDACCRLAPTHIRVVVDLHLIHTHAGAQVIIRGQSSGNCFVSQVGGQSQTKLVAGKIAHEARDGKPPALLAKGSASLNQAIKVRSGTHRGVLCESVSCDPEAYRLGSQRLACQFACPPGRVSSDRPAFRAGRLWRWHGSTSRRTKQTSRASRHSVTGERSVQIRSVNYLLQMHTARSFPTGVTCCPLSGSARAHTNNIASGSQRLRAVAGCCQ